MVTAIGVEAFSGVPMTEIVIPEGVREIRNAAFRSCENLTSITLPSTLETFGFYVFDYCPAVNTINIAEGNPYLTVRDNALIRRSDNTLIVSTSDVVSEGVKKLCEYAFLRSTITQITLPLSLTEIGNSAFNQCNQLTDVYYAGTPEQWATIKIGTMNVPLLNAKIHYSSTAP
jgi:hypothetical protein